MYGIDIWIYQLVESNSIKNYVKQVYMVRIYFSNRLYNSTIEYIIIEYRLPFTTIDIDIGKKIEL